MVQSGTGVGEETARGLLFVVGVLDFGAALLLLLPYRTGWRVALAWILPWALLTTLARLWSYGGIVETETLLLQWFPQTLRRFPHVLIPLVLYFRMSNDNTSRVALSDAFTR